MALGKRSQWVSYKHLYYMFRHLCKVDFATNNFIHAPAFSYNEVMHILELAGVAEQVAIVKAMHTYFWI